MFHLTDFVTLCWGIFLLYWTINWNSVKQTKESAWKSQRTGWIIAWILLIAYFFSPWSKHTFFNQPNLPIFASFRTILAQIVGFIFLTSGLIVAIVARKTLADNWSSNVELKKEHKLITSGIYKYVRHPIYTGVSLMGVGTFFIYHSLLSLLFIVVIINFFIFKLKKEEILLLKHFPKEYSNYMKKTKALIPFIF